MLALVFAAVAVVAPPASPTPVPDPCSSILAIVSRPTVTTGACTARDGHGLVELGFTNTTVTGAGGGNIVNYPQAFIRAGIGHNAEFNFGPPSYNRSNVGGALASGGNDMSFGFKWELGYNARALWGANVVVSAPTGVPAFSAGGTQYTANLDASYTLNAEFGLSGTLGFNSLAGFDANGLPGRFTSINPSLLLTAALPAGSQLFAEYAYASHAGPGFGGKSLIDFGYQKSLGDHGIIDVEYGFQLTRINGQKLNYVGGGISVMI